MQENMNLKDTSSASGTGKNYEKANEVQTVLVIDDELGPRESLKMLLKDAYRVVTAESGDKGIDYLTKNDADAVILDLRMPGKSGIETLEEIRKLDTGIPVIILTGYGDMETAKKAIHLNAIEFINKPFDINQMREAVKNACARRQNDRKHARMIGELETLNGQLREKMLKIENMATIGQLSAEIIHDVNNLLTVIYGYTQLLIMESDNDNASLNRKYAQTIEEEIMRCKKITSSVVDMARMRMEVEPISLNGIVGKVVDFFRNSSMSKNVVFTLETDGSLPFVKADQVQIHKALINIVLNGLQAIEKSGEILIKTRKLGEYGIILVRDTGKGIDKDVMERIFEPSFTTRDGGTGLGLSIASRVISEYGGRIEVKSQPGKGSEFIITIPLADGKKDSRARG